MRRLTNLILIIGILILAFDLINNTTKNDYIDRILRNKGKNLINCMKILPSM